MSEQRPTYGFVGQQPVHAHSHHYVGPALRRMVSWKALKKDVGEIDGFNAKFALVLTRIVGTMWCFYAFNVIAVPAVFQAVSEGKLIPIINAVSSNWIQLVLLPAIMVGQQVQAVASDARSAKQFADTEKILDLLDVKSEGGIKAILDRIDAMEKALTGKPLTEPPHP